MKINLQIKTFFPSLGQINDLADKLETWDSSLSRSSSTSTYGLGAGVTGSLDPVDKKTEDKLVKATKDACKITTEVLNGIMTQVIKDKLFNQGFRANLRGIEAVQMDVQDG